MTNDESAAARPPTSLGPTNEYALDPDFDWLVGFWQFVNGKFIDNLDNFREQLTTIIDSDESVHVGIGFRFGNADHFTIRYFWE